MARVLDISAALRSVECGEFGWAMGSPPSVVVDRCGRCGYRVPEGRGDGEACVECGAVVDERALAGAVYERWRVSRLMAKCLLLAVPSVVTVAMLAGMSGVVAQGSRAHGLLWFGLSPLLATVLFASSFVLFGAYRHPVVRLGVALFFGFAGGAALFAVLVVLSLFVGVVQIAG